MVERVNLEGQSGAESMLTAISAYGVEQIFASPGSEWSPLWEALSRAQHSHLDAPSYSSVGHEELAVAMASGYAKSSGKLPAVVIHTTVGSLHAAMAMRGAHHEQIPMVVLAGESIAFGEDDGPDPGGQWLGHLTDLGGPAALVQGCVKWSARVPHQSLLPSMVARACHIAETTPPGPVFVSVPMEYLFAEAKGSLTVPPSPDRPVGNDEALASCAGRLVAAESPLIITEEAGRTEAGVSLLVRLSEQVGAPVVETRGSRFMNFPRRHPLHAGFDPTEALTSADEILMCGVLAPWHPSSLTPGSDASVTVLRENPLRSEVPYWGFPVSHVIHGAIEPSLTRLLQLIDKQHPVATPATPNRIEAITAANAKRRSRIAALADEDESGRHITPRTAAAALGRALPDNAIVVDETLTARRALLEHIDGIGPGGYFSGAIGGLGTGLGTALGVKAANPDRLVVCTIGDGSLGYEPAFAALHASRELDLPILIVILNNSGYLSQKATLPKFFPNGSAVKHGEYPGLHLEDHVDFAQLAEAFGAHGESVADPALLDATVERAVAAVSDQVLSMVDIRLEPTSSQITRGD